MKNSELGKSKTGSTYNIILGFLSRALNETRFKLEGMKLSGGRFLATNSRIRLRRTMALDLWGERGGGGVGKDQDETAANPNDRSKNKIEL